MFDLKHIQRIVGIWTVLFLTGAPLAHASSDLDADAVNPSSSQNSSAFASRFSLQILNPVTSDSGVELVGAVSRATRFLNVMMTNLTTGKQLQNMIPVNERVDTHLYLHGAGDYKIEIWGCTGSTIYSGGCEAYLGSYQVKNADRRNTSGLLPTPYVQSDDPEIIAIAERLTLESGDDLEKLRQLHDWVIRHVGYDTQNYFTGAYKHMVYDALTVLHASPRVAICDGYANLFAALARAVGIRTRVVNGFIIWPELGETWESAGQLHAHIWNRAYINGHWIDIDTTWDSGKVNLKMHTFTRDLRQDFFDPQPSEFGLSHTFTSVSDH